jgi:glucose-6-phosphate 1-dehydrogenase
LRQTLQRIEAERGTKGNRLFYMATPPSAFRPIACQLGRSRLACEENGSWRRIIIEKPFGTDLASARKLNNDLLDVFDENQLYRIDHYLGKETVQNILVLRFANGLFEPIWNRDHIDHVQITVAETLAVGRRGRFYDETGALRDMVPNHLFQLLSLVTMEPPSRFEAGAVRSEKAEVLDAVQVPSEAEALRNSVRGQYTRGHAGNNPIEDYRATPNVRPDSTTETYAALRLQIDNWRWAGVPFFLRTGKRLGRRVTEIALIFKRAPHLPFDKTMTEELGQNALVIRVQPDEGITTRFGSKVPGSAMEVRDVNMDFSYGSAFAEDSPEAYERLILDMLLGEPSLFPVNREVELSWEILDPVLDYWASHGKPDTYESGTWGPESADEMMHRMGREWRRP